MSTGKSFPEHLQVESISVAFKLDGALINKEVNGVVKNRRVYSSVRSERQGIKAAYFMVKTCEARGHQVELIDPLEYRLPLLDKMYKEHEDGDAPELLKKMAELISTADAYIIVSGEYNHTIPPALANLLDHFLEEYFRKPSAIVCYSAGSFGGVWASIALRAMLAELGMSSIPSVFPIPRVHEAFQENGTLRTIRHTTSVLKNF